MEKPYDWAAGAILEEHSRRKHKILREYFFKYLTVRCSHPQQGLFRLAIVDGFAGGGYYGDGTPGSPLIFIEELRHALQKVNAQRAAAGMGTLAIECLMILNDEDQDAIASLRDAISSRLVEIKIENIPLDIQVEYLNQKFETAYPHIKTLIQAGRYRSAIFNLDQCGHSAINRSTLLDIMRSFNSAEIFYTFAIQSLIAFLNKSDPEKLAAQLSAIGLATNDLEVFQNVMSRSAWLGLAEKLVFDAFRDCARYVSPFSINNPDGWRYWLIHFANSYRARQVYNDVLHQNSTSQAHFGRSGLNMLSYNPAEDGGALYLFDASGRQMAKEQLMEDIPRLVSESGDIIGVGEFYEGIYNLTPAHTDDIHMAIIQNTELEVITPSGGERRKPNTISVDDLLRLKRQRSFHSILSARTDKK